MRFINRKTELAFLKEAKAMSKKKLYTMSIYGLRRVGKTRLILESIKSRDMYFFVNRNKTSESQLWEYRDALRKKGILTEFESLNNWDDFFKILFERYTGTVVFDEFQDFEAVDKSVFGTIQKYVDLNEGKKDILFIFSGSTIGLIKKQFRDAKEPLYGRLKRQLHLEPMPFSGAAEMCAELGIKDIAEVVKLYAASGGFPRYYVSIDDEGLKGKRFEDIIERFFFRENAVFEDEVMTLLSLEFGKRTGIYYQILAAVACGCTRISEIASHLGKKETDITRQLDELINYFELISVEKQVAGNKKMLYLNHPLMNLWFRYFYKNISDYKRRDARLTGKIKKDINKYIGTRFEHVCREFIAGSKLPFRYDAIGREWGKIRDMPKEKNQYEIDIVALNGETKEIMFAECKWQGGVDAKKIFSLLKEKAKYVQWNAGKRKEHYAIFAKSFRERIPGVLQFDLKDMEKMRSDVRA